MICGELFCASHGVYNTAGFYPLDATSITPSCDDQKCLLTLPNTPWRAELSPVRTAATDLP